jgi:hypothetical protein
LEAEVVNLVLDNLVQSLSHETLGRSCVATIAKLEILCIIGISLRIRSSAQQFRLALPFHRLSRFPSDFACFPGPPVGTSRPDRGNHRHRRKHDI